MIMQGNGLERKRLFPSEVVNTQGSLSHWVKAAHSCCYRIKSTEGKEGKNESKLEGWSKVQIMQGIDGPESKLNFIWSVISSF